MPSTSDSTQKDEKKRYDCVICKELFDCTQTRKKHVLSHADPLSGFFTCPICSKKFDEFGGVRKHIRAFHSDKQYPCLECDKVFPRPDKLKLHMLRHSDHREFLCQNCGKQFKRKDKLKEHLQRMHAPDREAKLAAKQAAKQAQQANSHQKKFIPKVSPTDYHRFIYKCHTCLLGFKRRGMLVNHLAKRHPDVPPETVLELNLPILKTTRDYYCQYCEKVYKSSSKRKAHILKNHPGKPLPLSNRHKGGIPVIPGCPNPTYSTTVGSITTVPHYCDWCHKQYASKAKLLQHQRKKHPDKLPVINAAVRPRTKSINLVSVSSSTNDNDSISISSGSQCSSSLVPAIMPTIISNPSNGISTTVTNPILNPISPTKLTTLTNVTLTGSTHSTILPLVASPVHTTPNISTQHLNDSVGSTNLITILGNIESLNSIITTVSGEFPGSAAELHELLESNPSAGNDLLTQAMSELTTQIVGEIKEERLIRNNSGTSVIVPVSDTVNWT